MDSIHDVLSELNGNPGKEGAIATIILVDGSSYRKEGASMFIFGDGTCIGLLSAGCLEEDLKERTFQMLKSGQQSQILVYDLSSENDLSWGNGAGCNGIIHVLLETIDEGFQKQLIHLSRYLGSGTPVLLIREISEETSVVRRRLVPFDYENHINRWKLQGARHVSEEIGSLGSFQKYSKLAENCFYQIYWPKPRLFVLGGGPDAGPLAVVAEISGFEVHVVDWREAYCTKKHFPSATKCHLVNFDKIFDEWKWSRLDAAIIMTHQFEKDRVALKYLLNEDLFYLGVMGPKLRTSKLIESREIPLCLDTPAGLNIGAEGPEEIAISIVGQMIQKMRVNHRAGAAHG